MTATQEGPIRQRSTVASKTMRQAHFEEQIELVRCLELFLVASTLCRSSGLERRITVDSFRRSPKQLRIIEIVAATHSDVLHKKLETQLVRRNPTQNDHS